MKNELVKYHNELNTVSMRRWTSEELNFFYTVLTSVKERGIGTFILTSDELKETAQYSGEHIDRWVCTMVSASKKASALIYTEHKEGIHRVMPLFQEFEIDENNGTVKVTLNPKYEYILNRLNANYTTYELDEYVSIRSTYAKEMYRQVKQYRQTGYRKFQKEEFNELFDVPKVYRESHVRTKILSQIEKELSPIFKNFKIKSLKLKKRGNPVVGYEVTFTPEVANMYVDEAEYKKQKQEENARKAKQAPLPAHFRDDYKEPQVEISAEEIKSVQDQLKAMSDTPAAEQISMYDDIPM